MPKKKTSPLTPEAFRGLELLIDAALQKRLVPLKEELKEEIRGHQQTVDAYIK